MRLIDADALKKDIEYYHDNSFEFIWNSAIVQAICCIDRQPNIDAETLPIVKQLRHELNELNEKYQMLERAYKANCTVYDLVCCNAKIAEIKLNAAIEQLRGDCEKRAHYRATWNGCTPDFECPLSDRCLNGDMWEWKGVEQNERTEID